MGSSLTSTADSSAGQRAPGWAEAGSVKALVFDVFGTVVDWRSSVARQVNELAQRKGVAVDGARFADAWRAEYAPSMNRVRAGDLPWTRLDDLHRMVLDRLVKEYGLGALTDAELTSLNRAWHRLQPWPDVVNGLTKLKTRFIIAPLSNGNIALMTNLARYAKLPWDCILGAELVRHYKPDREVYESAASLLDLQRSEVMMVAAHLGDLRAAKALGLRTAFVVRPREFGPTRTPDLEPDSSVDVSARDFNDLARRLGA
ncbi:MAG: haloacid dehalogenase type II [Acidimicrobiia bacterium]|nr:haloacid dehalogenase type II [Acidimicrobiia bacterium]